MCHEQQVIKPNFYMLGPLNDNLHFWNDDDDDILCSKMFKMFSFPNMNINERKTDSNVTIHP